ncbi:flavin monoamine oxidase family protein [Aspergillus alliaceus]|uniref:flavin monoamine oxidase family protein n=1 Tax=Petromyces alliaceus TaxID=209559 RepID=UPI0012A4327F|nr:uncharacterized protein BDW43DRAFT_318081 [Aspergillus alliaceus]KAB8235677.1 hypothetical protein BDW43DRAFT_318081 [Aspergillus alliaceus]
MHLFVSIWHIPLFIASAVGIQNVDVAIIGGGLSGLATAKEIAKAGKSFAILEARDRLRVEELGAEFVGPTQDRVLALAAELSLTAYPTYTAGKSISAELVSLMTELNKLASELDVDAPWRYPKASIWDGMTLKSFLEARITLQDSLFLFETAIRSILSTETKEPSLLYMLSYIAAAGNQTTPGSINRLVGATGSAQDSRINGAQFILPVSTQLLATALAEKLGAQNIYLDSPVGKVKLNGGRYTVMSNRLQVSAKHVVVAMSPPLAGRIFYDPLLPAGRDQLTQRMPMAFDNTPANTRALDKVSQTEVKRLVIDDLVKLFGPQAASASQVLLQQWDMEEFSRVLTQYGCYLRNPAGNIHFAGTKTSPYWTGYMDGAIRFGERAAAEVIAFFEFDMLTGGQEA